MTDTYAAVKRAANRKAVVEACENYVKNPQQHEGAFWEMILYFATVKIYDLEHEFSKVGTAETVDDHAQEVAINVWKALPSFKGTCRTNFYAWVHSICHKQSVDFYDYLKKEKGRNVKTLVVVNDDKGDPEQIDNPAIYRSELNDSFIRLPDHVQGVDRDICYFILNGKNYKQTATQLGLTEKAVKDRVYRLRNRLTKEEEGVKSHYDAQRAEQKGGVRRNYDEMRKRKAEAVGNAKQEAALI